MQQHHHQHHFQLYTLALVAVVCIFKYTPTIRVRFFRLHEKITNKNYLPSELVSAEWSRDTLGVPEKKNNNNSNNQQTNWMRTSDSHARVLYSVFSRSPTTCPKHKTINKHIYSNEWKRQLKSVEHSAAP